MNLAGASRSFDGQSSRCYTRSRCADMYTGPTHSDRPAVVLAASLVGVQKNALPQCAAQSSDLPTTLDTAALVITQVSW